MPRTMMTARDQRQEVAHKLGRLLEMAFTTGANERAAHLEAIHDAALAEGMDTDGALAWAVVDTAYALAVLGTDAERDPVVWVPGRDGVAHLLRARLVEAVDAWVEEADDA